MTTKEKLLRKTSIVLGLLILIGGGYLFTKISNPETEEVETTAPQVSKFVEVTTVKNSTINIPISTTGTLKSSESVDIYAEVSGNFIIGKNPFKTGIAYKKGDALLIIDDAEERLNIEYKKSDFYSLIVSILPEIELDYPDNLPAWKNYVENFDTKKNIQSPPEPKSQREKYFLATKNIAYKYLGIKKEEFTLTKYRVYAPFNGILDQVNINPGALVRTGQKLGTFINQNNFELEISVPIMDASQLSLGRKVNISTDNSTKKWTGKIKRIGKTIDESTQSLIVYVSVKGSGLFPGMYLNASINSKPIENAFVINRSLINKSNKVYIVEQDKVKAVSIQVIQFKDNQAIVSGIAEGALLISSQTNGIYEGMFVEIIKNN